jgi:hypothetical protein
MTPVRFFDEMLGQANDSPEVPSKLSGKAGCASVFISTEADPKRPMLARRAFLSVTDTVLVGTGTSFVGGQVSAIAPTLLEQDEHSVSSVATLRCRIH